MDKFSLELNENDRNILKTVASNLGYESDRDMINQLLKKFAEENEKNVECSRKKSKFKNIYDLPPEIAPFYMQLACIHSTTVSSVIFRYIIFPAILSFQKEIWKNGDPEKSEG